MSKKIGKFTAISLAALVLLLVDDLPPVSAFAQQAQGGCRMCFHLMPEDFDAALELFMQEHYERLSEHK